MRLSWNASYPSYGSISLLPVFQSRHFNLFFSDVLNIGTLLILFLKNRTIRVFCLSLSNRKESKFDHVSLQVGWKAEQILWSLFTKKVSLLRHLCIQFSPPE